MLLWAPPDLWRPDLFRVAVTTCPLAAPGSLGYASDRSAPGTRPGGCEASAYAGSEFYRRHHAGLYDAPLAQLPPVTKTDLMNNFDQPVTVVDTTAETATTATTTRAVLSSSSPSPSRCPNPP